MTREGLFAAVRPFAPGQKFTPSDVQVIGTLADSFGLADPEAALAPTWRPGQITLQVALELIGHEAIVRECYKDSVGVWTWGIGVTSKSGHSVERYRDNPQSIQRCIEIYLWLCANKYGPEVMAAFGGHALTEAQFAGALSFHYNTGAIGSASWVESWKRGQADKARAEFMNWQKPASIIERRRKERDLFFDGRWSSDGKATVYEVAKPSYAPKWSSAKRIDINADLKAALKIGGE